MADKVVLLEHYIASQLELLDQDNVFYYKQVHVNTERAFGVRKKSSFFMRLAEKNLKARKAMYTF